MSVIRMMMKVDWKAYVLVLFGFLGGTVSNVLSGHYGIVVGLGVFILSWWMVLSGVVIANRPADYPIGKLCE